MTGRNPQAFERLPATEAERVVEDRATREGVLDFFEDRYGLDRATFDRHSCWEKGAGSVWVVAGEEPGPVAVEALGLRLLRTSGHDWKPTTDGVQRFGAGATRNVVGLDRTAARRFVAGEDQPVEADAERGYVIVTARVGGGPAPVGVGQYLDGVLHSQVPKARRVDLLG